ncbi:MAG: hypothetical protein ACLQUZ_02055 [Rhizomicrobium sp.]
MKMHGFARTIKLAVVLAIAGIGLSGCFDLTQNVAIGRDGSGHYQVSLSAQGIVGEGLRNAVIVDTTRNRADLATDVVNGKVTRTAFVAFKSLSDLALPDQVMSLTVTGHDFFGLGPAHVMFRSIFHVDQAKKTQPAPIGGSALGRQIAQSIVGDHYYTFSVTVPGSIEHIAPVAVGPDIIQPTVTGDFYHGHTVIWRLPLYALVLARTLSFEVDFTAYGLFSDAKTQMIASE